jgi:RHS repeat-associated protein
VRGVVATSGSLTASVNYDAWGNPESSGGLSSYTPFGFAGAYTDPVGLIYLIGRYYDPATGQFLSVDPDVTATEQPYEYANDNPPTVVDPTGDFGTLQSCPAGVKTGNGRDIWDCRAAAFANNGSVVLIREGFVDKNGKGFGRVKIVQKHNVYMQTVANVVATTPREDIVHRGDSDEYESCVGFDGTPLPGGECVFVVVLLTKTWSNLKSPDNHEVGVHTAFCTKGDPNFKPLDPNSKTTVCPSWVNTSQGP